MLFHNSISTCDGIIESLFQFQDVFLALTGTKGYSMKTMLRDLHLCLDGKHHSGIDDSKNIAKILRTLASRDPEKLGHGLVIPKVLRKWWWLYYYY